MRGWIKHDASVEDFTRLAETMGFPEIMHDAADMEDDKEKKAAVQAPDINVPPGTECVVCMKANRQVACLPCGHIICCVACAHHVVTKGDRLCPLCRGVIVSYPRIYFG
jgi:hypothetical protein